MKKLIIATLLTAASTMALAESVIVTETNTWKSVPITVDATKQTYVVGGVVPDGDYYYTYAGYRCLTQKKDVVGVDPITYHATVTGGTDIYCYPE